LRTTLIVDLTQDEQSIWNNIRRKRRGDIKRAQRLGVTVEVDSSFRYWDEWFNSVEKLRDRIGKTASEGTCSRTGYRRSGPRSGSCACQMMS